MSQQRLIRGNTLTEGIIKGIIRNHLYWSGSWSRDGCSSLIGWWTCQSPAAAPKCPGTWKPWGPRWSRRLPAPGTEPAYCHPTAKTTHTVWFRLQKHLLHSYCTHMHYVEMENKQIQTHHISENHSSEPVDVYILQESVWVLLRVRKRKSDMSWCTFCLFLWTWRHSCPRWVL